jgi:hypothetical protein
VVGSLGPIVLSLRWREAVRRQIEAAVSDSDADPIVAM